MNNTHYTKNDTVAQSNAQEVKTISDRPYSRFESTFREPVQTTIQPITAQEKEDSRYIWNHVSTFIDKKVQVVGHITRAYITMRDGQSIGGDTLKICPGYSSDSERSKKDEPNCEFQVKLTEGMQIIKDRNPRKLEDESLKGATIRVKGRLVNDNGYLTIQAEKVELPEKKISKTK